MHTFALVIAIVIFVVALIDFSVFFLDKDTENLLYDSGEETTYESTNVVDESVKESIEEEEAVTEPYTVNESGETDKVEEIVKEERISDKESNYAEQLFADIDGTADDFASDIDTDELASLLQDEVYKSVKAEME